ncbi:Uncharacterized protein YbbP [Chlamydiales bacterium SCGC AG-110-M15]|nr:Uncharacterized protein YbbP [Chlamydiales bacterium SCGC AG-110-M15]
MEILNFITPIVEISILTVVLIYLLSFFWNTRAMDLVVGFLAFTFIYTLTVWLNLPVLQQIMFTIMNVLVIAVLIIFQPEIRLTLSRINLKTKRYQEMTSFDRFLEDLSTSVYYLAERHIGAIILIENRDSLDEFARKSVMINADFSSELLESIFTTTTPLHDGAVIIRETKIVSASTILPLAEDNPQIDKSMGTRHRAGLGISLQTDALSIIISEERGNVLIAREGIMTPVKIDRFKGVIRSIFNPPTINIKPKHSVKAWFKNWLPF